MMYLEHKREFIRTLIMDCNNYESTFKEGIYPFEEIENFKIKFKFSTLQQ